MEFSLTFNRDNKAITKHYKYNLANIERLNRYSVNVLLSGGFCSQVKQSGLYPYDFFSYLTLQKTHKNRLILTYTFNKKICGSFSFPVIAERIQKCLPGNVIDVMFIDELQNHKQTEFFAQGLVGCKLNAYEKAIAASISLNLQGGTKKLPFLFKYNLINIQYLGIV